MIKLIEADQKLTNDALFFYNLILFGNSISVHLFYVRYVFVEVFSQELEEKIIEL